MALNFSAPEATITVGLSIRKRSADGQRELLDPNHSRGFRSPVSGTKGPVPGAVTVPLAGVDVDLSGLTIPGLCWMTHEGRADFADVGADPSIYYVEYGIKDALTNLFYPWGELWPGDAWPMRLSRNIREFYNSTGTGTGTPVNKVHLMTHIAPCIINFSAYER